MLRLRVLHRRAWVGGMLLVLVGVVWVLLRRDSVRFVCLAREGERRASPLSILQLRRPAAPEAVLDGRALPRRGRAAWARAAQTCCALFFSLLSAGASSDGVELEEFRLERWCSHAAAHTVLGGVTHRLCVVELELLAHSRSSSSGGSTRSEGRVDLGNLWRESRTLEQLQPVLAQAQFGRRQPLSKPSKP